MCGRDLGGMPPVDLFCSTFPCQPYSALGMQMGTEDPRGILVLHSLDYIDKHTPAMVMMENVSKITEAKHKDLLDLIRTRLTAAGYDTFEAILNPTTFGIPQNRARWYLVAILSDINIVNGKRCFDFPRGRPDGGPAMTLHQLVKPYPTDVWEPMPGGALATRNVTAAYAKFHSASGVNPFEEHIVVDMAASPRFRSAMLNRSPTLTKTRAHALGYWDSVKGGPLSVNDMKRLMGFRAEDVKHAGQSDKFVAGCLGNGCSVTVLTKLLPMMLKCAGFLTKPQFNLAMQRSEIFLGLLEVIACTCDGPCNGTC